ncbi:MAG: hypothetical protein QG574_1214 [Cyanobacteriota bacterium erpe_2018_sw_21hr_WHONDRS-SW48-000092_B_bin.40]|jgi:hypothetical protein|nr:hypothetical protein [Cyanobacteriota bacterium erpe_2018_sw_21hr_WHONDRS-SW48-000092_B_bin.40]
MSLNEKFKKWAGELAEESAAETVTEIAIDQLPPVRILSIVTYACLLISLVLAACGWYFQTLHVLSFVLSGLAGFTGVLLYLIRMYVVAKLSKLVLTGYHHVKAHVQENLQEKTKSTNSPENL